MLRCLVLRLCTRLSVPRRCFHCSTPCMGDIEDATVERIVALHHLATIEHCDTYVDPPSGYKVFTSAALSKRKCCGNAVRRTARQRHGFTETSLGKRPLRCSPFSRTPMHVLDSLLDSVCAVSTLPLPIPGSEEQSTDQRSQPSHPSGAGGAISRHAICCSLVAHLSFRSSRV